MSSINLSDVTSGYNLLKISSNFNEIERVINEELLHRVDGDNSVPNTLETDVDANNQRIYNLPRPTSGGEPLRLKDLFGSPEELLQGPERQGLVAIEGQTLFTLAGTYVPNSDSIAVFRNGILLEQNEYVESSTNTITLNEAVNLGDIITVLSLAVDSSDGGGSTTITASNVGTGVGVYKSTIGNNLSFKTLKAGANITIAAADNELTISGVAATANGANLGATGEGIFTSSTGGTLSFKKVKAGSNVSLTSDAESITISATGGGGGSTPIPVSENGVLKTPGVTSFNFINSTVGVSGTNVTVTGSPADYLNVKSYGAVGDGVVDDSTAVQSAITAAKAANKSVFFPDGVYNIASLGSQTGRVFLIGTGNSTLRGTFIYNELSFPLSADTNTPLTTTSPYFHASGMNFQSVVADSYGLRLITPEQPGFISTFSLRDCRFFGPRGLLARQMIGFELSNCEFNNVIEGARYESCTNGMHVACRWQNQAAAGVWITRSADQTMRSPGGENIKFAMCEWAVCTYGVVADQHMWMTMESCLLDYCAVPLFLSGSKFTKTSQTYFGVSNTAPARFSSVPGYLAPNANGVAVYGRPGGTPTGSRTVGITAHNCEFINYVTGSTNPIVVIDGYVNGTYPLSGEHVAFNGCLFYHSTTHNSATILYIKQSQIVNVVNNRFLSYNLSSTLVDAWRAEDCQSYIGHSNDFRQCTQSNVSVGSLYETKIGAYVQATDPGAVGAGSIWVQP
jgi:hypothetical protein